MDQDSLGYSTKPPSFRGEIRKLSAQHFCTCMATEKTQTKLGLGVAGVASLVCQKNWDFKAGFWSVVDADLSQLCIICIYIYINK